MESTRIYGYARVSTAKQNLQRQLDNIINYSRVDKLYSEKYTGTKTEGREEFAKLKRQVQKDINAGRSVTIIFDSVSRMSRNSEDGVKQYFEWYDMGVNLIFLNEPAISTESYRKSLNEVGMTGTDADLILQGVNAFLRQLAKNQIRASFDQAEKEANDIKQRVKEGMKVAKENGVQAGRKEGTKLTTKKEIAAKEIIRKHSKKYGWNLKHDEAKKISENIRPTYYKYKKEMIEEYNRQQE